MRVAQIVAKWHQAPFVRGSTDCCAFCNFVWQELYGISYLPEYSTDYQAQQILGDHGSLQDAVNYYTGKPFKSADELVEGDIALIQIRSMQTIGIVLDRERIAVVFEKRGLQEITHHFVDGGWSWA